jgi:hypothetical protein
MFSWLEYIGYGNYVRDNAVNGILLYYWHWSREIH